jgi:uncharacterized protein
MNDETTQITPLSPAARRVLGVLIEKQKTSKSSDSYPLTLNALVTGCNQKSNRDPITDYTDDDVEETLTLLQRGGLVSKLLSGRADRYRHLLYEAWHVQKVELAVLAELMLRGPQSEGDLRGRASRMDDIPDLEALRGVLKPLQDRGMIVYLTPPDRRGALLTHGFHSPEELAHARGHAVMPGRDTESKPVMQDQGPCSSELAELRSEVRQLRAELAELRAEVQRLSR